MRYLFTTRKVESVCPSGAEYVVIDVTQELIADIKQKFVIIEIMQSPRLQLNECHIWSNLADFYPKAAADALRSHLYGLTSVQQLADPDKFDGNWKALLSMGIPVPIFDFDLSSYSSYVDRRKLEFHIPDNMQPGEGAFRWTARVKHTEYHVTTGSFAISDLERLLELADDGIYFNTFKTRRELQVVDSKSPA